MTVMSDSPVLVLRDLDESLLTRLRGSRYVAWDIETSGLDWSTDRIGTCQLHADDVGTVVVKCDGSVPDLLASLLGDPEVVKVFHHAPFDLRFMSSQWKVTPASVVCTKIASKLLRPHVPREAHTLQNLLRGCLDVKISKAERTSDWLAPHLTAEQLTYAAGDVQHLIPLYRALRRELRAAGLAGLYDRCLAHLPTRVELDLGHFEDVYSY